MIIDVSEAQGIVDWKKVKAAGVSAALIHVCPGVGKIDRMLSRNAIGASNEGISINYYQCVHPDKRAGNIILDAISESNYLIEAVKSLPKPFRYWADLERWDNKGSDTDLSHDDYLLWMNEYYRNLDALGMSSKISGLYGDKYYLDAHLPANHNLGFRPLWLANYGTNLKLPVGWDKIYMHQYTAGGKVDGISTPVDLNKLV